jgi:predicted signal transduction protein with EAL and GGDEF domain
LIGFSVFVLFGGRFTAKTIKGTCAGACRTVRRLTGRLLCRYGCSLTCLSQFPVVVLKIDRTFVTGLCDSADSRALAHTLTALGKTLGLQTLAEGVEEPAQLEILKHEECDLGQGLSVRTPTDRRGHPGPPAVA